MLKQRKIAMKNLITIIGLTSLLSLGCQAQKTQERPITNFTKIELSGSVNVFFRQSDTLSLKVTADSDEMSRVLTEVKNETLEISNKGKFSSPINIYVNAKTLNAVTTSGAVDFKTQNLILNDTLILDISGSSNVNINTTSKKIKITQNGASDLTLKGRTNSLVAEVSGASELKAYGLQIENADLLTTGASTAKVNVSNKLKANASGASTIKIKGDLKEIFAESTSAATIKRIEPQDLSKNSNDTTRFTLGDKKVIIIGSDDDEKSEKKIGNSSSDFKHWRGIFIGINGLLNVNGGTNFDKLAPNFDLNRRYSDNVQINIFERQFNIAKNYFKIITGFGIDYRRFEFAKKTNLQANAIFTSSNLDTTNQYNYKRNTLRSTYIQVPLMLEFNTSNKPKKSFHIAAGVVGQFLLGASTRQKLEQGGYKSIRTRKDDYNLSPFAAKAHVNFGYADWTIFGEYNLTPLFERGKGPELYPFCIGFRIINFS
jgi:hypothetical protein